MLKRCFKSKVCSNMLNSSLNSTRFPFLIRAGFFEALLAAWERSLPVFRSFWSTRKDFKDWMEIDCND